jgi:glucose-1-phosphate adenylyltransferase
MENVLSLILGGGRGTRLYPLTKHRSKPAVPIAGKYRLIDIPISNCLNSGLNRIYVLTQFLSVSLHRHIANTYKFDPFSRGFVEVLAAQQTNEAADWYQGTADAVRQNIRYIDVDNSPEVLVLSGDQLYRMDFRELIRTHRNTKADITIAALPVAGHQASGLGILRMDIDGRVVGFAEKPQTEAQLAPVKTPAEWCQRRGVNCEDRPYLASMGIYLFKREVLAKLLSDSPPATDFGKEIFPRTIQAYQVQVHLFDGYWEDLGTIKSYHESNLALASDNPPFDFHSPEGVIYTRMRFLPASRIGNAMLAQCLASDGCVIGSGTRMERCVVGVRSVVGQNVTLRNTVVIGADRYETEAERAANRRRGFPNLGVADGSLIENAILDKDCRIGRNVRITNDRKLQNAETEQYVMRDGVVVIPKATAIPDGTVI